MTTDFDWQSVDPSEVFEGVAAVLLAPVMLPLASAVNQPLVKSALREGIAFSERCQEAVAEAQERLDDTLAEARAEVDAQRNGQVAHAESEQSADASDEAASTDDEVIIPRREALSHQQFRPHVQGASTQSAAQVRDTVEELNAQVRWLTNDLIDLRMLATMGLGVMAVRQILTRGLRLDEIPWYVFAWYALDTFVKFHPDHAAAKSSAQEPPYIEVPSATAGV